MAHLRFPKSKAWADRGLGSSGGKEELRQSAPSAKKKKDVRSVSCVCLQTPPTGL